MTGKAGEAVAYSIQDQEVILACTTDIAAVTTAYVDGFIIDNGVYGA